MLLEVPALAEVLGTILAREGFESIVFSEMVIQVGALDNHFIAPLEQAVEPEFVLESQRVEHLLDCEPLSRHLLQDPGHED